MTPIKSFAIALLLCASSLLAQKVEVTNNQPFDIAMPWTLHDGKTAMVNVAASGEQSINGPGETGKRAVIVEPVHGSIHFMNDDHDFGTIDWDIVVEKLESDPTDVMTKRDFAAAFKPLKMSFEKSADDKLKTTWSAEGVKEGLTLHIDVDVYPAGFIDIRGTVTNESAPKTKVYAAVVTRWQQPHAKARSVNYNNDVKPLEDGGSTPFRAGGGEPTTRHLMIQRGADWLNCSFTDKAGVAWLNDFSPSFTMHHDQRGKNPPRWVGANIAQFGQEAMLKGDTLYSITEIARPNIKMYASRLDANVLPGNDQPLSFTSRLIISDKKLTDDRVDQLFIAYTGFNPQTQNGDITRLSFGTPHVKFGTAYFPYSTLGENFEKWHMPGQKSETYWPLSADTVTQYKLFADDIRRDFRIAKAMGFETIRLHHLELIDSLPRKEQDEYLNFLFGELKHLGLTALLDVKLPVERVVELVKKYRPQVDGVEIDNEVLIFGINDAEVDGWKKTYAALKEAAPDMPVWFTGHTNTGTFERLRKLGVPFDRVGMHAYMDSVEAIPSARDYALAVANYASETGKSPVITEWNWRFLTRMTPEARAELYPPIFENVLKTRCMPLIYQFQFQESLAMASRTLRGIRHYEQLNLSRRPRPEAFEFMKLIDRYGSPTSPTAVLAVNHPVADAKDGRADVVFTFTNKSAKPIKFKCIEETSPDVAASGDRNEITMGPGESAEHKVSLELKDPKPGFYHVFVRCENEDESRYAWAEVRNPAAPQIDKGPSKFHPEVTYAKDALDYDFNRDLAVVYSSRGKDSESRWDVESAWLIYQTLESATGRPVKIFQMNDLPDELRKQGNLIVVGIVVGIPGDHPLIKESESSVYRVKADDSHGDWLIVSGKDEASLNVAAIDLVLRYWMHAKDSGARRVPLTDKPIEKGADPSVLP